MQWIVIFNDGSRRITQGNSITIAIQHLIDWDYPIENVISIQLLPSI